MFFFVSKGLEICQKHEPKNGLNVLDDVLLFPNAFVKGDVVLSTSCRGLETTEKTKHFKHFPYILAWEPKTFIFRGDNTYFGV